jgi:formate hydrogenlyase subunit 4
VNLLAGFLLAPLVLGIVSRVKAILAGRRGPPLLQPYRDILRLLRKGAVYSPTTTWVFRAGPIVALGTTATALFLVPLGGVPAGLSFTGDFLVVIYLLALGRFFTVLAALDTGSAFEGMGASREMWLGAQSEPALLLSAIVLGVLGRAWSLTDMLASPGWGEAPGALVLVSAVLLLVLLAEGARIPFDDPTTHLELTMIHEVMILDHSGPDLALAELAAALKLWLLGSLLAGLALPVRAGHVIPDAAAACAGLLVLAVVVGIVESTRARLALRRVSQVMVGVVVLATLALLLVLSERMPL